MTRVTKHVDRHGASTHATRGLDFLEAVAPKLGAIADRVEDRGVYEGDMGLLRACMIAIPSYVEDLSDCYGKMTEARALVMRLAELNPDAGEIGPGMLAQLVADAREIVGDPRDWSEMNTTHDDLRTAVRDALNNAAEGGHDVSNNDETEARQLVDFADEVERVALTLAGSPDPGALEQNPSVIERAVALVVPHVHEWRSKHVQS